MQWQHNGIFISNQIQSIFSDFLGEQAGFTLVPISIAA